jgi:CheY-like chemotaxis protein
MQIKCAVRVLVVDNAPETRSQVVKMLQRTGYKVQAAEGQGVELEESAKALALAFKPHVVIMDLRLSDEHADDRSGLELWKDRSFSSAHCILYSAYLNQNYKITREALRQNGVEDVIGKEDAPQNLIDAVERAGRKGCGCCHGLSLEWPHPWNEEAVIKYLYKDADGLPHDLVLDVFGRLFPDTKRLSLKALDGTVKSSMPAARGRAVLFQATPDDREPVVIKLAPRERIDVEADAYKEFIQDRLVGRFYAELQKRADFWSLGGICYSFMGSSQKSIETFTNFYQQAETPAEILKPMKHFFEEVWSKHYANSRLPLSENIFKSYNSTLKLSEQLDKFSIQTKTHTFRELPGDFPNPAVWIPTHEDDSFFPSAIQAITHGDLHGDNLFVEKDHAWAIDFERSGPGHILRDFVELEEDIVARLIALPEGNLPLFYCLTVTLTKPISFTEPIMIPKCFEKDKEIKKALEVIHGLRSIAHEVTHCEDMHEYYWGLLLDAFFSLKLAEPYSPKWRQGLLLSSLLCARLKNWGRIWPLAGWLSLDNDQVNRLDDKLYVSAKENGHGLPHGVAGSMTNIYVGGNFGGNLTVGDGNQPIRDSYNKITSSKIDSELKETMRQLAEAVDMMSKSLSEEQAAEAAEDLSRLVDETTKPAPNRKWYSISIDGLIKAAENVEKVGVPVINLSRKVLSLLNLGLTSS